MLLDEMHGEGLEVERIENGDMYVKGHYYPIHGVPTVEALEVANTVKRYIRNQDWTIVWLYSKVKPFPIQTVFGKEMLKFLTGLCGKRLARIITHVVEYDGAYRFRVQDLFSHSTQEALLANPEKEIARLLVVNKQRDYKVAYKGAVLVSIKVGKFGRVVLRTLSFKPALWLFRRALQKANYDNLVFDTADTYWACMKTDYDYFGKTYEQRQEIKKRL